MALKHNVTPPPWHPAGQLVPVAGFGNLHVVSLPGPAPTAPVAVLLHGFLQSSWTWRHNLAALAAQFTVHAVCLPGFGWSDKPAQQSYRQSHQAERIVALLEVLGVTQAHLIGNSLGAALSLHLALVAPARVGKLVLVNPAASDLGLWSAAVAAHQAPLQPLWHLPGMRRLFGLGLRHVAYASVPIDQAFVDQWFANLDTPGAKRAATQVLRHYGKDLRALEARLPDIVHPALVLWGQSDRIVPRATAESLARRLGDGRLEIFDCSGHCPMEEEPALFNREVLRFLGAT